MRFRRPFDTIFRLYSYNEMSVDRSSFYAGALWALTLGILGSSCLPMPFALSNLGIFFGTLATFTVALANSYTGTIVLVASYALNTHTYEDLCFIVSGKKNIVKLISQCTMFLLLFGTQCASAALLADCGSLFIKGVLQDRIQLPSDVVVNWIGLGLLTSAIVFPLSLKKQIRSLEHAAAAGTVLVVVLFFIIATTCILDGFPALRSGDFPIFRIPKEFRKDIPESISILSFAFYLQPLLLPLLSEMPPGEDGLKITCKALRHVTLGIAFVVYMALGLFAGMRYGHNTKGDILLNRWLPEEYEPILEILIAMYIAVSVCPIVIAMRYLVVDFPLVPRRMGYVATTSVCVYVPMVVVGFFPQESQLFFSISGATAVCLIAYVFPVLIHLSLYFSKEDRLGYVSEESIQEIMGNEYERDQQHLMDDNEYTPLLVPPILRYPNIQNMRDATSTWDKVSEICSYILVPIGIMLLGLCSSIIAMRLALM